MTAQPGRFITFEGIDGAGKSTHVGWLAEHLRACGKTVVETREPGGTAVGEALREILLHQPMHLETEALLMFAARRENIAQVIAPALARGDWVLCDRFTDASFAYQGGGKGLGLDKLAALEYWVHAALQPDLTLLFDVPTGTAQARLAGARNPDKFEREGREFFENVRQEYLRRAGESPHRFAIIDSTRTVADIRRTLQKTIADFLN